VLKLDVDATRRGQRMRQIVVRAWPRWCGWWTVTTLG